MHAIAIRAGHSRMYIWKSSGISASDPVNCSLRVVMYESRSKGLRLSSVHVRDSRNRWLASILSYSSRNRRRVGRISEKGTKFRQSEQTHLEDMRHFRLMKEKQRNSNVWGSTKLSDIATGGRATVSDEVAPADDVDKVTSADEIDTAGVSSRIKADWRRTCLLKSPFKICHTISSPDKKILESLGSMVLRSD